MELMRDHFEGTDFDMTQDVGAGPFACPYRWRPMTWKVDTVDLRARARHLDPADGILVRFADALVASRTRSAASSGSASTTPTAPCTTRSTAASRGCPEAFAVGHRRFPPLLVEVGLLGVQLGGQLRLLALRRHDQGHPGRAARSRGLVPRRAAGRRRGRRGALPAVAGSRASTTSPSTRARRREYGRRGGGSSARISS